MQCVISDLQSAGEHELERRSALEEELATLETLIRQKETEHSELVPRWNDARGRETAEKRKMEEVRTQLNALFAKQGRVKRFRTKAERDDYLRQEIASLDAFLNTRSAVLESTRKDLASTKASLEDIVQRVDGIQGNLEDGKQRVRTLGEQLAELKNQQSDLSERRKELWREDSKLGGLLAHAGDELKSTERNLASMMDKVGGYVYVEGGVAEQVGRIRVQGYVLWIGLRRDTVSKVSTAHCTVFSRFRIQRSTLPLNSPLGTGT